jgi:nicotinamidase-related amidase
VPTRTHFPRSKTALLLVDVLNPFDFLGGRPFARRALATAERIRRLAERARSAGVPVIYVNDNLGRWRSDVQALIEFCARDGTPGAPIAELLAPEPSDFVVLKSTLSGFFQTALETMLRLGGVENVVVTGFATDNCVFLTSADAYMRDFKVIVPRDAVAAQSATAQQSALRQIRTLFDARTPAAASVRLRRT